LDELHWIKAEFWEGLSGIISDSKALADWFHRIGLQAFLAGIKNAVMRRWQ
jgi:hypothetical protein